MSMLSSRIHKCRSAKEGWLDGWLLGEDGIQELVQCVRVLSDEYNKRRAAASVSLDNVEEGYRNLSLYSYW